MQLAKKALIWLLTLAVLTVPFGVLALEADGLLSKAEAAERTGAVTLADSAEEETGAALEEDDTDSDEDPELPEEPGPLGVTLKTRDHVVYISGDMDLFRPEDNLTRAEAVTIICSLLSEEVAPGEPGRFNDVPVGAWYQPKVDTLAAVGAISGYQDGSFRPNSSISRAEFLSILSRFFTSEEGEMTFPDVREDHWAYGYIANAVSRGWVSGYPDGTFKPANNITRAEAVSMVNRVLGRVPDKTAVNGYGSGHILRFLDVPYTGWYYYHVMEASIPHAHETDEQGNEVWSTFTVPTASRSPGYHLIDGQLYKVDGTRHFAKDLTDGVLTFDHNGRYTTGDAQLDAMLTTIVLQKTVEGDTAINNLERLFRYVAYNFPYLNRTHLSQGVTGWEPTWAKQMILTGRGNCYSFAALFTMLARKLGYQATGQSGLIHLNWDGSFVDHGWTEIVLDGKTYYCDPECQGIYVVQNPRNWWLFMKSYSPGSLPEYMVNGVYKR